MKKNLINFLEFVCETGLCKKQDALTYEIIVNEYMKSIKTKSVKNKKPILDLEREIENPWNSNNFDYLR